MKLTRVFSLLSAFLLLLVGMSRELRGQETPGESVQELLTSFKDGDYASLEEIFKRKTEAIPFLIRSSKEGDTKTRAAAIDLLRRIDLEDDDLLNTETIVLAMTDVINSEGESRSVVAEALRALERIDITKANSRLKSGLILQIQHSHERAVTIIGQLGDPTLKPFIESYVSRQGRFGDLARQALAKLGEQKYLEAIVAALNLEGVQRSQAFRKLVYIKNRSTVREIAKFLYDSGTPAPEVGQRDIVIYFPYRYEAAMALGLMVDNPPIKKRTTELTEADIVAWRLWWEGHQREYP